MYGLDLDLDNLLDEEHKLKLRKLLLQHKDIFSTSYRNLGQCDKVKHWIDVLDDTPCKLKHRTNTPKHGGRSKITFRDVTLMWNH